MKTTEELEKELEDLIKEKKEIVDFLSLVSLKEQRLRELIGHWHDKGEIELKKLEIRDSKFPIYSQSSYGRALRIIDIDDKWISLRYDGSNEITRYKKENGWRERSRNDIHAIDIKKAIEIWESFKDGSKLC